MAMKKLLRSPKGVAVWLGAAAVLLAVCLVVIGLSGDGQEFPVYISEILASNTGSPNGDGRCADYIELHNGGTYAVDLTGYQLGDIAGSLRYAFPAGTVMEPGSYLVVWCDKEVDGYAPFGISRSGGESFYLIASNNAIVDKVVTVATDPDQAMIRSKNGDWSLSLNPTPGMANDMTAATQDIYNAGVSPVRISEFSSAGNGFAREQQVACEAPSVFTTTPHCLTSPWSVEKLSSTKPVPGAKNAGDRWTKACLQPGSDQWDTGYNF